MTPPRLKVVHIIGCGRSGSTILGDILGAIGGWFHTGELRGLWQLVGSEKRRCSCGEPVRACDFWSPILDTAWGDLDPAVVRRWVREDLRSRDTGRIVAASREDVLAHPRHREALALSGRLYRAVAERAGARVLVDSSKRPPHAALMSHLPDVDSTFLHLVRDPRGVAFSKSVPRVAGMLTSGPVSTSATWVTQNLAAAKILRRHPDRSLFLRYEDFARRPRETVAAIVELAGEGAARPPFLDDHTVELGPRHTVKGNPNRFVTGPVEIRTDEAWTTRLPASKAALVTALTLPLLVRYRYPLGRP